MRFGTKIFGKCHRVGRKTCSTNGESIGTNKISVNLAASNTLVECIGGRQHLTFKIDAKVSGQKNRLFFILKAIETSAK